MHTFEFGRAGGSAVNWTSGSVLATAAPASEAVSACYRAKIHKWV